MEDYLSESHASLISLEATASVFYFIFTTTFWFVSLILLKKLENKAVHHYLPFFNVHENLAGIFIVSDQNCGFTEALLKNITSENFKQLFSCLAQSTLSKFKLDNTFKVFNEQERNNL